MKKILLFSSLVIFSTIAMQAQQKDKQKLLRHVVLFGWKEGTDSTDIKKIIEAFKKLPSQISQIKTFEWGTNNSPENLNQGLTHCFFVTFSSEKDRDAYLVHPAHKAFVDLLKPAPDKVTVLDYWVQ